jgi:phosphate starvation-inducible PhoH-like protein
VARGDVLTITGRPDDVDGAEQVFRDLLSVIRQGGRIDERELEDIVTTPHLAVEAGAEARAAEVPGIELPRRMRPRTEGQQRYLDAILNYDVTIGIGPAGTGKTYLAVAVAVAMFKARRYKRIILTRPAVEAGERLGFLPGDLQAKIDPYLRPLYDALFDMIDADRFDSYLSSGAIEVAPLAFMRGRTLNDAFIILDEAQNTTAEQMKMFLTRMGFQSKVVVTGDVTQIDLPGNIPSGLMEARRILEGIEGIAFIQFRDSDVVRHPLVARIVKAYDDAGTRPRSRP